MPGPTPPRRPAATGAAVAALTLLLASCGADDDGPDIASDDLEHALLTLNWVPYGEHAPFYYGVEEGFFAEEGIELNIKGGGGSARTVEAVAGLHTEFGWADTAVLTNAITEGMPVKSAGVFLQRGPASVEFFADQDVSEPTDLAGMTIAGSPGDALYSVFPTWLEINGMSEDDVEIVNVEPAAKVSTLIAGEVDAIQGFFHDQAPTIAHQSGEEVEALLWADWGLNLLGTGPVVHEETIAEEPELIEAFLRATVRSFEEAMDNPEDAVDAMSRNSDATYDVEVLSEQFALTQELLHTENTEGQPLGVNAEEDWEETIALLVNGMDVADEDPDFYWDPSFAVEDGADG